MKKIIAISQPQDNILALLNLVCLKLEYIELSKEAEKLGVTGSLEEIQNELKQTELNNAYLRAQIFALRVVENKGGWFR